MFSSLKLHMCKQSIRHVSKTKYLWSSANISRQRLVKSYFYTISVLIHFSLFLKKNVLSIKIKSVNEPSLWQGVHGPGPWKWCMDRVQSGGPCFVLNPRQQRCLSLSKGFPLQPALLQLFCSASWSHSSTLQQCCSFHTGIFTLG